MTVHLFYNAKSKLKRGYTDFIDERIEHADENDIAELLKLFKLPYVYESRIDFGDCENFYIKRSATDVENGVFSVTYSPAWNCHEETVQMTGKALKKKILETEKKAG